MIFIGLLHIYNAVSGVSQFPPSINIKNVLLLTCILDMAECAANVMGDTLIEQLQG